MIRLNIGKLVILSFIWLAVTPAIAIQEPFNIELKVDATKTDNHLLQSEMEMSVSPGEQYLWYPNWLPGVAGATDQVTNLVGLVFYNDSDEVLEWRRDATRSNLFRVTIPEGTTRLRVRCSYIANHPKRLSSAVDSYGTDNTLVVNFNTCLMYPDGIKASDLQINTKIKVPSNWSVGCALPSKVSEEGLYSLGRVSLEHLIDSPFVAGKNYRKLTFTSDKAPITHFHLFGEEMEDINITEKREKQLSKLLPAAVNIFEGSPFDEYSFLVVCTSELPLFGLEHSNSSLNIVRKSALKDNALFSYRAAYLLSHELTHAWCGKHRLPKGMLSSNFHTPLDTELLWVYEGLTQYLMQLVAVRSGLVGYEDHLGYMAFRMAEQTRRTGRDWRPLVDTAIAANTLRGYSPLWKDLRRSQDYYDEGALFWMQVDCILRKASDNRITIDDFCKAFFSLDENDTSPRPYELAEIVDTLENLSPGSWQSLIDRRIYHPIDTLTLDALMLAGYRLSTNSSISSYQTTQSELKEVVNTLDSIGLSADNKGKIIRVLPNSAAEKANVQNSTKIIAVNRKQFSDTILKEAIHNSARKRSIEFIVQDEDRFSLHEIDYDKGTRYPALKRLKKQTDRLKDIFSGEVDQDVASKKSTTYKVVKQPNARSS